MTFTVMWSRVILALALAFANGACVTGARPVVAERHAPPVRAVVISDLNGAYGSTSYDPEVPATIAHITGAWRPDVVLLAGDMIAGQSPRLADSVVRAMWQAFDSVVAHPLRVAGIPLVATLGNHDGSAYPAHARDRRIAVEYWKSVPHTQGSTSFSDRRDHPLRHAARYGNVFIASWDATNAGSGSDAELLAWLEAMLASPEARGARHRVVLGHLPLYAVAEGRNRAGEVIADGDALRQHLERWGATMYVSGHHHAYYPGRRGRVELLHAGALGGGPRPLIGETVPRGKTASLLEFHRDSVAMRTYRVTPDGTLHEIPLDAMPPFIRGVNGPVLRRDRADADTLSRAAGAP
jgi:hypothetical protein